MKYDIKCVLCDETRTSVWVSPAGGVNAPRVTYNIPNLYSALFVLLQYLTLETRAEPIGVHQAAQQNWDLVQIKINPNIKKTLNIHAVICVNICKTAFKEILF